VKLIRQLERLEAEAAGVARALAPGVHWLVWSNWGRRVDRLTVAGEYVAVDVVVRPLREPGQFPPEVSYEERFTREPADLGWVVDRSGWPSCGPGRRDEWRSRRLAVL
jgi:hypothetical protein